MKQEKGEDIPVLMEKIATSKHLHYWWWILLGSAFLIEIFVWWPGILRPDSVAQLSQAQQGIVTGDAHPPIMAFYWYFLNLLYPGPGLMLLTHLSLLFASVITLSRCFQDLSRWFFIGILFFPPIFCYAGFVLKDIGFSLSYLFVISILAFHTIHKKPLNFPSLFGLLILIFYGTAVKYQAIFLLPIVSFWTAFCTKRHVMIKGLCIWAILWTSVTLFNDWASPKKDHWWQYVKLYDLAAISIETGEHLILPYNKTEDFSYENIIKDFDPSRIDSLFYLLKKGANEEERSGLWDTWAKGVLNHPMAYLKHRFRLNKYLLSTPSIKPFHQIKNYQEFVPNFIKEILYFLENWKAISLLQSITAFYIYMPFVFLYIALGIIAYRRTKTPYGLSLLAMNGMALFHICVLFIFSLSSDARYIYISVCLFHFSHPFMIECLKSLKTKKLSV